MSSKIQDVASVTRWSSPSSIHKCVTLLFTLLLLRVHFHKETNYHSFYLRVLLSFYLEPFSSTAGNLRNDTASVFYGYSLKLELSNK